MKSRNLVLLAVLLLVIVAAVVIYIATQDEDDDNGDNGGDVALDQSFEAAGISINYPTGWVARESDEGGVEVANSQAALAAMTADDGGPSAGQAGVTVLAMPLSELGDDVTARDAFDMMFGFLAGEGEGTTVSEVSDVKVGDKDAYRVNITDTETSSDGFLVGFEDDGALIIGAGIADQGELDNFEATMLRIIASADYTAPATE